MTRPGDRLRSIASSVFRPEEMERIIDPAVADLQCEWGEAAAQGRRWQARLVLLRGYLALGRVVLRLGTRYACDPRAANPGAELARAGLLALLAFVALTAALTLPPALQYWARDARFAMYLCVLAIPQALPLSVPAALSLGVLSAARGTAITWRGVTFVSLLAAACSLVGYVTMEWMIPDSNQWFREAAAAHLGTLAPGMTLQRGLSELGFSGLRTRTDAAAIRQYHLWLAVCVASFPLGLLSYGVAGYVRGRASAIAWSVGVSAWYMVSMWTLADLKPTGSMPGHIDAWGANVVCLLAAVALLAGPLRRRSARLSTANLR